MAREIPRQEELSEDFAIDYVGRAASIVACYNTPNGIVVRSVDWWSRILGAGVSSLGLGCTLWLDSGLEQGLAGICSLAAGAWWGLGAVTINGRFDNSARELIVDKGPFLSRERAVISYRDISSIGAVETKHVVDDSETTVASLLVFRERGSAVRLDFGGLSPMTAQRAVDRILAATGLSRQNREPDSEEGQS